MRCAKNCWCTFLTTGRQYVKNISVFPTTTCIYVTLQFYSKPTSRQRVIQQPEVHLELTAARPNNGIAREIRSLILTWKSVTSLIIWEVFILCLNCKSKSDTHKTRTLYINIDTYMKDLEEKQNITYQSTNGQNFKQIRYSHPFSVFRGNEKLKTFTLYLIIENMYTKIKKFT